MQITRQHIIRGALHLGILVGIGTLILGFARPSVATVAIDDDTYRVTGPFAHDNLAVYLIHAKQQDPTEYVTLEEGLRSGDVKVMEKDNKQVNELVIENVGDRPLFLQEGDRVQGGEQDRIIYVSHVVPPHSGRQPVAAFCVEAGRWQPKDKQDGKKFEPSVNPVLAPLSVRTAAKVGKDQGQVWAAVAGQKVSATQQGYAGNTNTSLNETLDAPKVKQVTEELVAHLKDLLDGQADAVGVIVTINGQVQEMNIYPNRALLVKQYERLLGSYALDAMLQKTPNAKEAPTAVKVCDWVWRNEKETKQEQVAAVTPMPAAHRDSQVRFRGAPIGLNAAEDGGNLRNDQQFELHLENIREAPRGTRTVRPTAPETPLGNRRNARVLYEAAPVASPPNRMQETINASNQLDVIHVQNAYKCTTSNDGKVVHRQFMKRAGQQPAAQQRVIINNEEEQLQNAPPSNVRPQQ